MGTPSGLPAALLVRCGMYFPLGALLKAQTSLPKASTANPGKYKEPDRQLAWEALAPPVQARPRGTGSRLAMHHLRVIRQPANKAIHLMKCMAPGRGRARGGARGGVHTQGGSPQVLR
jgi:hypothetical protein